MVARKAIMVMVALLVLALLISASPAYATHGLVTSSSVTAVNIGQRATYQINVTNAGGDPITGIVTDFQGFVFAGGVCPSGFSTSNTAQALSCSNGSLANLTSATLTLDLTAPDAAGTYYFTTTSTDNRTGTSSSMIGISVKTPASLSVTPAAQSVRVGVGSTFTVSATLNNDGQANVTNPTLTIGLPSGYALAQDETQLTKGVGVGYTVSWNVKAPSIADASDRSITFMPAGTDNNTGGAAPATQGATTVGAIAVSVSVSVDKTSAVYGDSVAVSGYVKEGDSPVSTAYVSLVTSYGSRQTTYTSISGYYSFVVFMPDRSGEQRLDVTATSGDLSGSASASVFVGELLVDAAISPASVGKGGLATVRGTVKKSGLPVSGAEITTKMGTKAYSTGTDAYGVFSQTVSGTASGTNRVEVTATSKDGKMGAAILSLSVAGVANKTMELVAPSTSVVPSENFTVSGKLYSDGEKTNGTVDVVFADVTRSIDAPDGDFSLSLSAPKEGCYDIVVRGGGFTETKRQVCAYSHEGFSISISARNSAPGANVITITALYEDGSPVSGTVSYGIESTQYFPVNFSGARLVEYNFTKAGKYFVSAYVDDGIRRKTFSKYLEINATAIPTPAPTMTATAAAPTQTPTMAPTATTANATTAAAASEAARTNLALLLIGGIIILFLFF